MTYERSQNEKLDVTSGTLGTVAHPRKAEKATAERRVAIERTRGMFAHLAPGESLADELIADRRAEVHAEELQETERRRHRDAG